MGPKKTQPPTTTAQEASRRRVHPLQLVAWLADQYRKPDATINELVSVLEKAQMTMEEQWEWNALNDDHMRCGFTGCNYHRYPISSFCFYHVTGHDTFAARLRRRINRDKKQGKDVGEFEGVLRLVTENVVERSPKRRTASVQRPA